MPNLLRERVIKKQPNKHKLTKKSDSWEHFKYWIRRENLEDFLIDSVLAALNQVSRHTLECNYRILSNYSTTLITVPLGGERSF